MQLHDRAGKRKYLTPEERLDFLRAANGFEPQTRTFCQTLVHTGCRISEALQLTASRVDLSGGVVIFESLKKRRKGVFRAVPVPPEFLRALEQTHDLRTLGEARLWNWSRTTGWRSVCAVMEAGRVKGLCATPKGIRHAFGVNAIASAVPLNMVQKWMGHASMATTSIYCDAVGPEELRIAERMWRGPSSCATPLCEPIKFPGNSPWPPLSAIFHVCAQFMAFRT
jgi:integrase/recombinase XerD